MIKRRCPNRFEGCTCSRAIGHAGPCRCEHQVSWAVRPDGRFVILDSLSPIPHPITDPDKD